jgi:hypothetical protein
VPKIQVPIVSGIYATTAPDLRTALPLNMVPTPKQSGISTGYLRPGDGIVALAEEGPGNCRGGIVWNNRMWRVMGSEFLRCDAGGAGLFHGDVGDDGLPVTMDYSFDDLAIISAGNMYIFTFPNILQQVPLVSGILDLVWIDGYYMVTDGEFLSVTELGDPMTFNPIKYASSEADPDPIIALERIRNEVYALNRYTIEVFDNIGGAGFPFARIEGAQIEKGTVGTHACCVFMETIAFLGGGRNEQLGVYLGINGTAQKISTQEIDYLIQDYTETQLALTVLEQRNDASHWLLYVHLPDFTLVYDAGASQELGTPVWFMLSSSATEEPSAYRARFFLWWGNSVNLPKWYCGDSTDTVLGYLDRDISSHYGDTVAWEFSTPIVYNDGDGALFNRLELVALTGSYTLEANPTITTSYSLDGRTWAQARAQTISAGTLGERAKRIAWFQQGYMSNWRIQRFQGDSTAHVAFVRLECELEPLAW